MPHNPVQQKIAQTTQNSFSQVTETAKKSASQEVKKTVDSGLEQLTGIKSTTNNEYHHQETGDTMTARISHETETQASLEMNRRKLEEVKRLHQTAQNLGSLPTLEQERQMKEHQERKEEEEKSQKKGFGTTLFSRGKNLFSKMDLGTRAAQRRESRDQGRASG